MMDARRAQVYTGIYRFLHHELIAVKEQCAEAVEDLMEELNRIGEPVILLGDGVSPYLSRIRELLKVPFSVAPAHMNRQRAGAVGALGEIYFSKGMTVTADEHRPEYLRASQAEREQTAKGVPVQEIEKNSEKLRPKDYS